MHPNIGSTFLVASTSTSGLYLLRFKDNPAGIAIVQQSLPILLAASHKPFGDYLGMLVATIWHDDELEQLAGVPTIR